MGALSFLSSELSMRQGGPGNAWPSQEDAPGRKPLAITLGRALTSAISEPRRICVSQMRKRGRKRHPATEAAQKQTRAVGSQTSVLCPTARCPRAGGRGRRDTAHGTEEGWEAAAAEAGGTRAADRRGEAGRGSEHQGAHRGAGSGGRAGRGSPSAVHSATVLWPLPGLMRGAQATAPSPTRLTTSLGTLLPSVTPREHSPKGIAVCPASPATPGNSGQAGEGGAAPETERPGPSGPREWGGYSRGPGGTLTSPLAGPAGEDSR